MLFTETDNGWGVLNSIQGIKWSLRLVEVEACGDRRGWVLGLYKINGHRLYITAESDI